jgi:selenide,water dikinase
MGGVPKTAMNLVGFPIQDMDISVLRQMLKGGLHKMQEAQVVLVGGHSVEDSELKYGLSVTGYVHPAEVLTKKNLQPGDKLILTKPLGTGILNTAIKAGLVQQQTIEEVTALMAELNRSAAEIMRRYQVRACTDITGFGLLGHLAEMVQGSKLGVRVWSSQIPVLEKSLEFAGMGLVPAGAHKNREFRQGLVHNEVEISPVLRDIMFDPQTSGGLLISVEAKQAQELLQDLQANVRQDCALLGEVVQDHGERIFLA